MKAKISKRKPNMNNARKSPFRKEKERFLIVCEGKETEINYFNSLINLFQINRIVSATHFKQNPSKIAEFSTIKLNDGYDKIYCVFDKDKHGDFGKALNIIKQNEDLQAIISNPCFEYWILLHFEKTTKPFGSGSKSPCDELVSKNLKNYIQDYSKNYDKFENIIQNHLQTALLNAKEIDIEKKKSKNENLPFTDIWILINKLEAIKEKYGKQ